MIKIKKGQKGIHGAGEALRPLTGLGNSSHLLSVHLV